MREILQNTVVTHRFPIGTMVRLIRTRPLHNGVSGPYEVLARLPERDGELQYRIKSEHEPYQRIVKASELESADI
jgi:hypothetical protein